MSLLHFPSVIKTFNPGTSNGAIYASGDQIGILKILAKAAFSSTAIVLLKSLVLLDKSKQKSALDILFFSGNITNAVLDNATADLADADLVTYYQGKVSVAAADYVDLNASSLVAKPLLDLMMKSETTDGDLYALVVSRGTPTYTSVDDLVIRAAFQQLNG